MGCSCLAGGGKLEDIMRLPCTALGKETLIAQFRVYSFQLEFEFHGKLKV